MAKIVNYKYCIVPKCKNTTITTPEKIFINMPKIEPIRKKWCHAMKRCSKKNKDLAVKSTCYCCDDHFNLQEDMENYTFFKMMGSRMQMKKNVVPSKFDCQKNKLPAAKKTGEKRARIKLLNELLTPIKVPALCEPNVDGGQDPPPIAGPGIMTLCEPPEYLDKAVQVNKTCNVRSKGTSTVILGKTSTACSPMKSMSPTSTERICVKKNPEPNEWVESTDSDSDFVPSLEDSSAYDGTEVDESELNMTMRNSFFLLIEKEPRIFLGIPHDMYHVISLIVSKIPASTLDVLVTLKKIRLDDSNTVLGLHFGISHSTVSRIFSKTVVLLAAICQDLIIWPSSDKIRRHLPISFRARYANVQSIIECLELQIEKPSNPIHQALTWSEYKGCNTLKYLISCTPDGLINYISCGYGGRASDCIIIENCGYLDLLKLGMAVMADRGFKNISHLLEMEGCSLIRPPSVFANMKSSRKEVQQSKRIAALRIHVERVISRVREFHMLRMGSTLDHHHMAIADYLVIIACGIINLQGLLIKI